jgi:hypothetical protein
MTVNADDQSMVLDPNNPVLVAEEMEVQKVSITTIMASSAMDRVLGREGRGRMDAGSDGVARWRSKAPQAARAKLTR